FGSTTGDLVKGIRQFGFQAIEVSADPAHLRASRRPAILSVWNSQVRHSVVWTGQLGDGTQIIIDPLAGRRELPGSELWNSLSSPRAIALSRPLADPLQQPGRIPER
ncbi:MAG TPA: cysteine peptidase family C39 domain-containing protein, partial [Stenomitos sp.]